MHTFESVFDKNSALFKGGWQVLGEEKMQGTMGGEMVETGGNLASREREGESFNEGRGSGTRSAAAEERVAGGGKGGGASEGGDLSV